MLAPPRNAIVTSWRSQGRARGDRQKATASSSAVHFDWPLHGHTRERHRVGLSCCGEGRSFVDLKRGIFYWLAEGRRATKKCQPPAPIPRRLLAHLQRWAKADAGQQTYFVEWAG